MSNRSSVTRLDPRVREAVDGALREGRATIDEIVDMIRAMGGEASRSAVGRYKQRFEAGMQQFRVAREMAGVWGNAIEKEPDSPVARLANQVLAGVALNTATSLIETGEAVPAGEVMFLAKALDHLSRADKNTLDKVTLIRREIASRAADVAGREAKSAGLSDEQADVIRRQILGIAA